MKLLSGVQLCAT